MNIIEAFERAKPGDRVKNIETKNCIKLPIEYFLVSTHEIQSENWEIIPQETGCTDNKAEPSWGNYETAEMGCNARTITCDPAPKFKVGDRVRIKAKKPTFYPEKYGTIDDMRDNLYRVIFQSGWGRYEESELESAPDPATIEALIGSIKKWEAIYGGWGVDEGISDCPLCAIFVQKNCCGECPIALRGFVACEGSPYNAWARHQRREHGADGEKRLMCPVCKELAKDELDFLKDLYLELTGENYG